MKYTYHRLREIYRKIGGEDSGKIYDEFFRAINNNELDENQALIKLVTELAERDLSAHERGMSWTPDNQVYIVQIYNPGEKEYHLEVMKLETYEKYMIYMKRNQLDGFVEVIHSTQLTQEQISKIKAGI